MLKEKASIIYRENQHLNCAESMLHGANEVFSLDLNSDALSTMSTFGGGMGVGSVCGALTGGLAALGVLLKDDESLSKSDKMELAAEFYRRFYEKMGTDSCVQIRSKLWDLNLRCEKTVFLSADILEDLIRNNKRTEKEEVN